MKKLKVGLFGGSGKMGQQVELVLSESQHNSHLFVGSKKSDTFSFSVVDLKNVEPEILDEVDVWIDFSAPQGLADLIKQSQGKPIVSGTTGISTAQFKLLKTTSKSQPVFWASNMSIGLWSFRQALKGLAHVADFDFSIEEIHHSQKKDMPSGTALTLQHDLETIVGKKISTPLAHRIGGVYGVHTVLAASQSEIITFQHQAINRKVFASGALRAAEWLVQKKNGFYSMDDLFLKRGAK